MIFSWIGPVFAYVMGFHTNIMIIEESYYDENQNFGRCRKPGSCIERG
jgi:hypothetical protein